MNTRRQLILSRRVSKRSGRKLTKIEVEQVRK